MIPLDPMTEARLRAEFSNRLVVSARAVARIAGIQSCDGGGGAGGTHTNLRTALMKRNAIVKPWPENVCRVAKARATIKTLALVGFSARK